jgi:hypothetical protein
MSSVHFEKFPSLQSHKKTRVFAWIWARIHQQVWILIQTIKILGSVFRDPGFAIHDNNGKTTYLIPPGLKISECSYGIGKQICILTVYLCLYLI